MSTKMTKRYSKTEVWPVASEVAVDTPLLSTTNQPGWALTASGGHTASKTVGPYTVSGILDGGVGLGPLQVTVATDGAFRADVAGASAATARNTIVYITSGGALTLTVGTNTKFGKVDRFIGELSATETSVTLGVF